MKRSTNGHTRPDKKMSAEHIIFLLGHTVRRASGSSLKVMKHRAARKRRQRDRLLATQ